MDKKILTRKEAAELLMIHPQTATKWAASGVLPPSFKIGRRVFYKIKDLEKAIKKPTLKG